MTYLSEGCLDLTGYQSEELVENKGATTLSFMSRLQNFSIRFRQRLPSVGEYRILINHQQSGYGKGRGVFDSSGEVLGLEGFITDIPSNRKQLCMKTKTPSES